MTEKFRITIEDTAGRKHFEMLLDPEYDQGLTIYPYIDRNGDLRIDIGNSWLVRNVIRKPPQRPDFCSGRVKYEITLQHKKPDSEAAEALCAVLAHMSMPEEIHGEDDFGNHVSAVFTIPERLDNIHVTN